MPVTQLLRGRVLPLARGLDTASSVLLQGEDIVGVDSSAGDGAAVSDFGDRTIMPGFIDAHAHAQSSAIGAASMLDCVNTCSSIEEMQQVLLDQMDVARDTGWLHARGLFQLNVRWSDGRYPTREDLDRITTKYPVALRTGHISVLSTKAMEVLELHRFFDVKHGSGGPVTIQRGDDGQPNGRITNLDGLLAYPEADEATMRRTIAERLHLDYTARGTTTVCEISDARLPLDILTELLEDGTLASRFKMLFRVPRIMSFDDALHWRDSGIREIPGLLEMIGVKLFADGGMSSGDAALEVPYLDHVALEPGSRGVLSYDDAELADLIRKTRDAGLQLALHSLGERCQEQVCRVTESLGVDPDLPVRLEHGADWVWNPDTPSRWKRAGAVPVPNPAFIYLMASTMPGLLGDYARRPGRLPFRSLMEAGWDLPAGSDATCYYDSNVSDPIFSMWATMKRESWDGSIVEPDEALSLEQALRMHTVNGAKALGEGDRKGTLEAGKLADLLVLDRDITDGVDADNIRDVKIDFVYVGGRQVFARDGAQAPLPA
ncbi:amidohydrolase [Microbacterium gorillae]|uniref:amidohydrolase n=1 Tax=Microbacterium gorillae TaxID=1231063 RepID=UPI00058B1BC8|nr:amidohydrolase family protein [Microbacterium gorillae]